MESIDVNYGGLKRYDTTRPPLRQRKLFTAILRALCGMSMIGQAYEIEKINMEGLKPPYILLSNHMYFVGFHLCSSKKDLQDYGDILCMYPEARYSPIGTTAILPDSLGKLVKKQGVPVVVLLHHGNYLHTPFWNYRKPRKVPLHTTMTQILTAQEVSEKSAAEIGEIIRAAIHEFPWQREKNIRITEPFRAEGLHKVLYQCPHCLAESRMESRGATLRCAACGKTWELDELGVLHAGEGETEFAYPPDWFEWEREQVRSQLEAGTYHFEDEVEVYSLPNAWRFQKLGKARLIHDMEEGFIVEGEHNGAPYRIHRPPLGMYGLHVEYDYCYVRPDDCVDISTDNDSLYCYPTRQNVVTKLSFATEELYKIKQAERKLARRSASAAR